MIATLTPGTAITYRSLYEMTSLYLAANEESKAKMEFDLHAYPFREPATALIQVRARWYHSATGTWLAPDPAGYRDSSSMYAFAGVDAVNGRDSSGQAENKNDDLEARADAKQRAATRRSNAKQNLWTTYPLAKLKYIEVTTAAKKRLWDQRVDAKKETSPAPPSITWRSLRRRLTPETSRR